MDIKAPSSLCYDLIRGGKAGRLTAPAEFLTGITGHDASIDYRRISGHLVACSLSPDGRLAVRADTEWDFGSGPAIDTPAVVIASLPHDMLCHMTNLRLLPWSCRADADRMYRVMLAQNGVRFLRRWWQYVGVRAYSEALARWKDRAD